MLIACPPPCAQPNLGEFFGKASSAHPSPLFGFGTIGFNGDLRPKFLKGQSPVCLRSGPYEAWRRGSPRLQVRRKKNCGGQDAARL
jgi:hypothetical protein